MRTWTGSVTSSVLDAVRRELGRGDLHRDQLRARRHGGRAGALHAARSRRRLESAPYSAIVFGKTKTSIAASRSSSTKVAISSPRLGVAPRRGSVTTPPTVRTWPAPPSASVRRPLDSASTQLARCVRVDEPAQRRLEAQQRMVAHVEAEHLLLEGEPLGLVELDVGDLHDGPRRSPGRSCGRRLGSSSAKSVEMPSSSLAPTREDVVDDLLEDEAEALARVAERVEAARLDERLDRALVEHRRVDPAAEVVEVDERPVRLPLGDDQRDETLADVAHRREPEDDRPPDRPSPVARGGEVRRRDVDVGDEDLDAERPALGEVDRASCPCRPSPTTSSAARYSTG